MRRYLLGRAGLVVVVTVTLAGCASGDEQEPGPPSASETTTSAPATPVGPGEAGVSPGGVTTAVGAPAESTEDDYFQACRAAKTWMQQQGGDPRSLIEPYLATVQRGGPVGAGDFAKPWAELTPGQQSGVIVAVEAAADDLCG